MKKISLTKLLDSLPVPAQKKRDYLGASAIGSDCAREIWYALQGVEGEAITPRLKRIFDLGHLLETLLLNNLQAAGVEFAGLQVEFSDERLEYFRGSCDAVILKPRIILEIKSAKDSSFKQFVKHGLLKWQPRYFAQVQAYMGMSGIQNAIVLVINKDTCEVHEEWVTFQPEYFEGLRFKAEMIKAAKDPPPRVNDSPVFYLCKICRFRGVCHDG